MRFSRVSVPGIKRVITICSAKGGVGKSTTSVNVALALKNMGHSVGLVDADITGPSIPTMMGVESSQVETYRVAGSDRFGPPMNFGVKVMSMGLIVPYDEAIAVRGPMVNKYIRALLFQTDWEELDYLLIDMPPGTNDVHLTITQEVMLSGAVIVSTPQKVALIDVRRGIDMFAAVNAPVLGLVENMSYFKCDSCDKRHYMFGRDGVARAAEELGVPFLGEIPFLSRIMQDTDEGVPPALRGDATLEAAKPYYELAERIHATLGESERNRAGDGSGKDVGQRAPAPEPTIVFE
ncbi:MRP protein-like protein [Leishmania donovani]|uniref:MRP_protein-like_protein n=3 Tax=Leishmania donovani species complex TaxID=38574 RepID=A0A6L0XJH2_LEIIN|nr:MRP protein-like protein [Leishmania infantum JPCM5]XP_003862364.1 MRP protein-like protein [Leishmania donovani]CAC9505090.1 MRP_protein-like_protein [Leishmania infantum]AYU80421.1 MRP protein-like protein [Leishmania donovani]TPP40384.1 ParA/MinD ATPase like family protein [Leishmania donovani]TPP54390.1 ParA/MinD ATPase like family protein [Leishmania donovani]CAJ1990408.1 MRP protein-like protein [Leishmania donovani]|eukprot:XP_001470291.1 MRP protein-like protein [Leishmania infantum JPCM5]